MLTNSLDHSIKNSLTKYRDRLNSCRKGRLMKTAANIYKADMQMMENKTRILEPFEFVIGVMITIAKPAGAVD